MKILILISNNLEYDTRVKRHIKAIAKRFDNVLVCLRPIPDEKIHLSLPNVNYKYFNWDPIPYPASKRIMLLAEEMKIANEIWPVAPALLEDFYYEPSSLAFEKQMQDTIMKNPQWEEVLQGIPEEAELSKQMGWVTSFLDCSIQWAKDIFSEDADVIYCNDIDTLTAGVAHKIRYNSRLIYDAHDIYCDIFPGIFPRMHRNMLALLERQLLRYVDALITVSQSELDWIKKTYRTNLPAFVICNCTENELEENFKAKNYSLPLRLYYHGNADATRGIENIIEALNNVPDIVLNLRCLPGEYLDYLKEKVSALAQRDRIFFLEPVDSSQTAKAAHFDGDIGIHACSSLKSVDIEVSLTNKFIEYLKAGLPIITSPIQEQSRIIKQFNAGYVLRNNSVKEITSVLELAKSQIDKLQQMSQNALDASDKLFDWKEYEKKLLCILTGDKLVFEEQSLVYSDNSDILNNELQVWKNATYFSLCERNKNLNTIQQYNNTIQQCNDTIQQHLAVILRQKNEIDEMDTIIHRLKTEFKFLLKFVGSVIFSKITSKSVSRKKRNK